jgi:gamma-glutamylcyclotransferase
MCAVMQKILYFAYGSNMLTKRLQERAPSAKPVGIGYVMEHHLRWHKKGRDGSGKCDIFFTGDQDHQVHGVLFEISGAEKTRLDGIEGLNRGYDEKMVEIITVSGLVSAVTYYARVIDERLRPYEWYKRYVVEGAIEYDFPEIYVQELKSVEAVKDLDLEREQREKRFFE